MELFSQSGWLFLLRWFHFLAGITWIGMLYYFNFVQTPFFARADAPVRAGMIAGGLVDNALWWFRWGAMLTIVTGWLYILHLMFGQFGGPRTFFATDYGWKIFIGAVLGSTMWFNVWFVIWPAQRVVIASARQVAGGGQAIPAAAARGARGGIASRTNTMLSIPMLFFMGAASHLPVGAPANARQKIALFALLVIVVLAAEINALAGPATPDRASVTKKLLTTGLKGTLWSGFVLTAILYVGLVVLFP